MNDTKGLDQAKTETLVLRLWKDGDHQAGEHWRGSLIHPETERQIHVQSIEVLVERISELLRDVSSSETWENSKSS
jgi:hypothetical protein